MLDYFFYRLPLFKKLSCKYHLTVLLHFNLFFFNYQKITWLKLILKCAVEFAYIDFGYKGTLPRTGQFIWSEQNFFVLHTFNFIYSDILYIGTLLMVPRSVFFVYIGIFTILSDGNCSCKLIFKCYYLHNKIIHTFRRQCLLLIICTC